MGKSDQEFPGAAQSGSDDSEMTAWKAAIASGDTAATCALAARFVSFEGGRWMAFAGHVAYFYLQSGEPAKAAEVYEEILRRDASNAEARYFAFLARLREGRADAARHHLRTALDQISTLPEALREPTCGYARLLLGFDSAKGRGIVERFFRSFWRGMVWPFLPPPRWSVGEITLALWRWAPVFAPRQFRAPRPWRQLHGDAAAAVGEVRAAAARVVDRRRCSPGEMWVGSVKTHESLRLYSVARWTKPRVVVQVGVFAGYSACLLAEACRRNGEGIVHCIDPNVLHRRISDPMASARELVEDLGLSAYVRFHKGTFATPLWDHQGAPDAEAAPVVGPQVFAEAGRADLVLVDGDHTAPAALADITLAVCHLADGGAILVHDTMSWPQVRLAISAALSENRVGVRSSDDCAFLRPYGRRVLHFFELCPGGIDGLGLLTLSPLPSASAAQD